jgi:hypothetical protein
MNFTAQIVIARPRKWVVELIRNPEHFAEWQPGWHYGPMLVGEPNQVGSQRRVYVQMQGVRLEMVETILAYRPPEFFASVYLARGVKNLVENRFYADSTDSTRWMMSNAFHFTGLMKFVGGLVGDVVPKQTVAAMQRVKQLAERS